ncbi:hypothetical protein GUITHDRAFT_88253 [Guillardia theta CCMP2712]|uniref:Folate/biopterin transporter n=2 Tax=Guillardia theta TaxID=55529 RepID=L1J047_GUITC|nr:hypothetical protein GUITHDRAFT_88253 [Guillardia theta CCMP2712]EKX41851.1 hypothetical protein GUITHDRAFT_88253 [Guillardia theta CCMP2712]|eukprot:XP_005828831.1 hypothetical protein GUITHDRAFT_88253 [Guillardia theta CCMP2712]
MADPSDYDALDDDNNQYKLPENPTITDYVLHPYRGLKSFKDTLLHNFGWKFTTQIGVMYLFVKGLLNSIMGLIKLSYCKKSLQIDGNQCQTMMSIAMTPWAIKGAMGVVSDAYPLLGYHKKSYIIASAFLGTFAFFMLASTPIHVAWLAAIFLFLANFQIATCDLLCEGKYAERMQAKPKTGSTMVSFVWGCFQLGSFIASVFVGPIADNYDPQIIFWVCIPLAASILIPTVMDYLGDEKVEEEKRGIDWSLLKEHTYMILFCLIMAAVAMGNAIIDLLLFQYHQVQALYAVVCSVILCILAFRWLPPQLARCNLYMFISCVLYINISGAQDFWFTADDKCVPGGPAFDYTYYNTYASLVGSVTGWIGIVLFQATMSDWNFRTLFWVTTLIQIVAASFDMLIIARVNIAWGISDKAFYMFGDAVIGNVVGMFGLMPMLVLTSKLVPKGLEATTYALLAGFQNFGGVVSSQIGVYATQAAGIKTKDPCDFENLNMLVLVCHCLLPLIAIPLTFLLIPNKRMTDKLIDDEGREIEDDQEDSLLQNPARS